MDFVHIIDSNGYGRDDGGFGEEMEESCDMIFWIRRIVLNFEC